MAVSYGNIAAFQKAAADRRATKQDTVLGLGAMPIPGMGSGVNIPQGQSIDQARALAAGGYQLGANGERIAVGFDPSIPSTANGGDPDTSVNGPLGYAQAGDQPGSYYDMGDASNTPYTSESTAMQAQQARGSAETDSLRQKALAIKAPDIEIAGIEAGGKRDAAMAGRPSEDQLDYDNGFELAKLRMSERNAAASNSIVPPKPLTDEEWDGLLRKSFSDAKAARLAGRNPLAPDGSSGAAPYSGATPGSVPTGGTRGDAISQQVKQLLPGLVRDTIAKRAPGTGAPLAPAAPTVGPKPKVDVMAAMNTPGGPLGFGPPPPAQSAAPAGPRAKANPDAPYQIQPGDQDLETWYRHKYGLSPTEFLKEFMVGTARGTPHPSTPR